jgi:hypothetical protein
MVVPDSVVMLARPFCGDAGRLVVGESTIPSRLAGGVSLTRDVTTR